MVNPRMLSGRNRHLLIVARATVLAAVLLYLAGYLALKALSKPADREELVGPKGRQTSNGFFYCSNCNKEFTGTSGSLSARCPDCREKSTVLRIKKQCENCGKEFVSASFDSSTHKWSAATSKCPACGSEELLDIHPEN